MLTSGLLLFNLNCGEMKETRSFGHYIAMLSRYNINYLLSKFHNPWIEVSTLSIGIKETVLYSDTEIYIALKKRLRERPLITFFGHFDLPILLYNVPFLGLSWTPLPTLITEVINGRSLGNIDIPLVGITITKLQYFFTKFCKTNILKT